MASKVMPFERNYLNEIKAIIPYNLPVFRHNTKDTDTGKLPIMNDQGGLSWID